MNIDSIASILRSPTSGSSLTVDGDSLRSDSEEFVVEDDVLFLYPGYAQERTKEHLDDEAAQGYIDERIQDALQEEERLRNRKRTIQQALIEHRGTHALMKLIDLVLITTWPRYAQAKMRGSVMKEDIDMLHELMHTPKELHTLSEEEKTRIDSLKSRRLVRIYSRTKDGADGMFDTFDERYTKQKIHTAKISFFGQWLIEESLGVLYKRTWQGLRAGKRRLKMAHAMGNDPEPLTKVVDLENVSDQSHSSGGSVRYSEQRLAQLRTVFERTGLNNVDGIALDLGCGYTPFLMRAFDGPAKVANVDVSINLWKTLRKLGRLADYNICMNAGTLPFADDSVDFIFSAGLIAHIANLDTFVNECKRVLKPGGYIYLDEACESKYFTPFVTFPDHVNMFNIDSISAPFEENFDVIHTGVHGVRIWNHGSELEDTAAGFVGRVFLDEQRLLKKYPENGRIVYTVLRKK